MKPAQIAALYERKQRLERDMLRAMRRYDRVTQQVRRLERKLDKDFNTQTPLPAETTAKIPGKVELIRLIPV